MAYLTLQINSTNLNVSNLNDHSGGTDTTKGFESLEAVINFLNQINGGLVSGPVTVEVATSTTSSTLTNVGTGAKNITFTF
jgi:phage-related tail protein